MHSGVKFYSVGFNFSELNTYMIQIKKKKTFKLMISTLTGKCGKMLSESKDASFTRRKREKTFQLKIFPVLGEIWGMRFYSIARTYSQSKRKEKILQYQLQQLLPGVCCFQTCIVGVGVILTKRFKREGFNFGVVTSGHEL